MILLRYLMLETFKSQVGILFVLLLIFVSQKFIAILAKAINGVIPPDLVLTLLYLNLPTLGTLMLPISFYLAVLFAHGRLHGESEMVAMTSCGYSPNNVLKATLLLSLFTFAFAAFNSLYLAPMAEDKMVSVIEEAESDAGAATLIEGRFHTTSDKGGVVYVEKFMQGQKLERVFAAHWPKEEGRAPSVLTSLQGVVENKQDGTWLTLMDGQRYAGIIGQPNFDNSEFDRFEVHIANREVTEKKRGVEALSTEQLFAVDNPNYQAELHWRFAIPISILMITFMAVPMAKVNPRQGRYAKLLPALALYLTFFLLLSTSRSLIEDGSLPATSIWGVLFIFLGAGIVLHMQALGKFSGAKKIKNKLKVSA
ncbi:LPS export ABC transporter permease LptF [Psychromonas sp. psych-6C06]|uniref:LPS export ABC transporter permease LptF n=1 Tax=Psychromonas sp. psych-6C06 TaxID=2058089 RepID=UPI000C31F79D|nr:LPS export ABC transporter permease LptF [Psychromonas sp. psych-6C06]PKF63013.1 LPS export ABC transporter permease LptF [Psychromonas sp. psych-6C06]